MRKSLGIKHEMEGALHSSFIAFDELGDELVGENLAVIILRDNHGFCSTSSPLGRRVSQSVSIAGVSADCDRVWK